jgi:hypothetical protein
MTEIEARWTQRVRAWKASGATAREFAQGRGYAGSTLLWWSSRLGSRVREVSSKAVPVSSVRMVRAVLVAPRSPPQPLLVRVGSASVEVRRGFDGPLLREVVEALGGAS